MPNLDSAIKKARQDVKRTRRNRLLKEKMHDSIAAVNRLAKTGAGSKEAVSLAYKKIDKALKGGLLKPATAARRKARVARTAKAAAAKTAA